MNTREAVQELADLFAELEAHAIKAKARARGSRKCFEAIRDEGHIGDLECQSLASQFDKLATDHEAALWAMHSDLTKRAKELGIDLPQRDGGR